MTTDSPRDLKQGGHALLKALTRPSPCAIEEKGRVCVTGNEDKGSSQKNYWLILRETKGSEGSSGSQSLSLSLSLLLSLLSLSLLSLSLSLYFILLPLHTLTSWCAARAEIPPLATPTSGQSANERARGEVRRLYGWWRHRLERGR